MSSMKTIIAIRIPFTPSQQLDGEEKLNFIRNLLSREPDEFYDEEDWFYEANELAWVVNTPDDNWYLDLPLKIEGDSSDINHKVSINEINHFFNEGKEKLEESSYVKDVGEGVLSTLYFYDGAASGLSDISY